MKPHGPPTVAGTCSEASAPPALRTLLAHRDPHLVAVLRWLLAEDPRFDPVGVVANGERATAWPGHLDAALVDLALPGLDALSTVRALCAAHPGVTVAILADVDAPYLRAACAAAGAAGYLDRRRLSGLDLLDRLAEWCTTTGRAP